MDKDGRELLPSIHMEALSDELKRERGRDARLTPRFEALNGVYL